MYCGSKRIIKGVSDRIQELTDTNTLNNKRPPYLYQVPLEYIPKLGPKTYQKLLDRFHTEMYVIHQASLEDLLEVVPASVAHSIISMRKGEMHVKAGGGGKYGSVTTE